MIQGLHHLVLTVASPERAVTFYQTVFNGTVPENGVKDRIELGNTTIFFQTLGKEMRHHALEGGSHFCLLSCQSLDEFLLHLEEHDIAVLEQGAAESLEQSSAYRYVFINDCDNNLIEVRFDAFFKE